MQPRYAITNDYYPDLVDIINYLANSIDDETRSLTTSSILNMLTYTVNDYENNRFSDLLTSNTQRAKQVSRAAHLYQNHYEKHLHRHAYSDDAAELSRALSVYEESVLDDIQTMNLSLARMRAELFMQFLDANAQQLREMEARIAREQRHNEMAGNLQGQVEVLDESDEEATALAPLFDDIDFDDSQLVWETSPLLLENFESEDINFPHSPIASPVSPASPASPRFFTTPVLGRRNQSTMSQSSDDERTEDDNYVSLEFSGNSDSEFENTPPVKRVRFNSNY